MKTATEIYNAELINNDIINHSKFTNEYKRGVLAGLHLRCDGLVEVNPFSGMEGGRLWRDYADGIEDGKKLYEKEKDRDKALER